MSDDNVMLEITNLPTICLSMIIKNESAIICRFLDSVKDIIDYACICDTGSTDDTVATVEKYMEDNNLKGHIIKKEFVDFSTNRNYALEEAKKYGDYILLLDADMKLMNCDKFDKTKLDGRGYRLKQYEMSLVYYNIRLVPSNVKSCYIGVTHEYLSFDGVIDDHDTLYIDDKGDGGCKADKFTRDERLLRKGLEDDPSNARYAFYLANTLTVLGKIGEAIKYYKMRIPLGGWDEEVFYSQYQIGVCYEILGEETLMEKAYLDAWEMRPSRAEPLYDLAKYFRLKGKNTRCFGYSTIGKTIKQPDDKLFVHSDKYGIAFDRELTISSFYIPISPKGMDLFDRIFINDCTPLDIKNFMFYARQFNPDNVLDFSCKHNMHIFGQDMEYVGSTPCIIPYKDGYIMNIRLVNYRILPEGSYCHTDTISTVNKRVDLDNELCQIGGETVYTTIGETRRVPITGLVPLHGVEDIRISTVSGDVRFIGTTCNSDNKIGMCIGDYHSEANIVELDMLDQICEKNWSIIPGRDRLEAVYKWHPLQIIEINKTGRVTTIVTKETPSLFKHLRGSTNGCIYDGCIYFCTHLVIHGTPRKYVEVVAKFDLDMNYIGCSYPFKLSTSSIEYCLGMIVEENRIIFSYSENDASSKIAVINRERFLKEHWMD